MKKLITFLFLLTVYLSSAMAQTSIVYSASDNSVTITNPPDDSSFDNWSLSNYGVTANQIKQASTIILKGNVGSQALTALNACRPTTLDLRLAKISNDASLGDIKTNLVTLYMPQDASYYSVQQNFCSGASHLEHLYLYSNIKIINSNAFLNLSSLESVEIPEGVEYIGSGAFNQSSLESIEIPGTVTYIGESAFSIATAEKVIFNELSDNYIAAHNEGTATAPKIRRIVLENGYPKVVDGVLQTELVDPVVNMTIGSNAFQNAKGLWDVYVLTTGTILCATKAFNEAITYGQGATDRRLSVLHYPEEKAEDYVNQNHLLTSEIAHDSKLYQAWLVEHASKAGQAGNGWFEFVEAGPSPRKGDPGIDEKFLKTWSESGTKKSVWVKYEQATINHSNGTTTTYYKVVDSSDTPKDGYVEEDYYMARLVPDGVRAYIVNGISNDGVKYTLTLNRVQVIPPNTGVILYGQANATTSDGTKPALLMKQVPYVGYPLSRESKAEREENNKEYDSDLINYLVGTGDGTVTVDPYEDDPNTNEVAFRNFFMNRFTETDTYRDYKNKPDTGWTKDDDYIGFFRAKHNDSFGPRKAYLHLDANQFPESKGYECIVAKDVDYDREYDDDGILEDHKLTPIPFSNPVAYYWANRYWEGLAVGATNGSVIGYDWGNRPTNKNIDDYLVSYRGEFEREVDGIVTLTIPAVVVDNEFYTLQGVKVTNPTKSGIYIKNGKKIVIK